MTVIRQVTTLLGYGEPQILEAFKNTLTKEKIDRQLAGQSFSTLFMSNKNSYNNKKVTSDM